MASKIPVKQITSWSFSRYSDYKQCPYKAKLKHVDKLKEPANDAMMRGTQIHTLAEKYVKGEISRLPPELKLFKDLFKQLKAIYKKDPESMVVEDNWSFTSDWDETSWDDWVNCWVRIKLDCAHHQDDTTLIVSDYKTGKFREDQNEVYLEQLELYALSALLLHEHIEQVLPRLIYLDVGTIYPGSDNQLVYTRADIPKLKKIWEKRVKPMMSDKIFAPRPNDKCRWCYFRKANNGPCKY